MSRIPPAHTHLLSALMRALGPSHEIVLSGPAGAPDVKAMARAIQRGYHPRKVLLFRPDGDAPPITELAEYTALQVSREGQATAYVCREFTCDEPTTEVAKVLESLRERGE